MARIIAIYERANTPFAPSGRRRDRGFFGDFEMGPPAWSTSGRSSNRPSP